MACRVVSSAYPKRASKLSPWRQSAADKKVAERGNRDKVVNYRFTGHDTFHCRYAWLPKAVSLLDRDPVLFTDTDKAMVEIGVGKNMVQSIQFWAEATGVIQPVPEGKGMQPTPFGRELLLREGYDPYLESDETLWLLHWLIATNREPLFAWDFLLNRWHRRDFCKTEVLEAFQTEVQRQERKLSAVTLETHFDVFLHSYVPTRSRKGEVLEDNLDCPLVELRLLFCSGERVSRDGAKREPTYAFRVEEKPEISDELFIYCLNEFWRSLPAGDQVLDFRTISINPGSPGQIFKLPEKAIRDRLERIEKESNGTFVFEDTAVLQQVRRVKSISSDELLFRVYENQE